MHQRTALPSFVDALIPEGLGGNEALERSVGEQRFCQCKRAATLSVPPSPSEDAAAPVWRPGTPLART